MLTVWQASLSIAKRAKARPATDGATTKTLKAMVQGHVMDQVAMKLQSQNRTKQVERRSALKLSLIACQGAVLTVQWLQVGALFQLLLLEELMVAENSIRVLPGSISCFDKLRRLDMHSNRCLMNKFLNHFKILDLSSFLILAFRLMSIPPDLGLCSELTDLNLSDNELAGMPTEIRLLVSLKLFDVSKNQISSLPNEIGNLCNLELFDIRNNKIEYLPVELEALSAKLQTLLVDGNDIKDPVSIYFGESLYDG
jgi:hypothetical protein